LLIILTPFSSTTVEYSQYRYDKGVLSCIIYSETGEMIDRLFPNLQVEMGGGEYLFGTSFGIMRSENPTYPSSMFVLSPQLDDSCNDGTTIVGSGYSINISTSCSCAASYSSTDLVTAGVDSTIVSSYIAGLNSLGYSQGMVSYMTLNGDAINITQSLTATGQCGGVSSSSPPVLVCQTSMFNHRQVTAVMEYITDGTTSSIAAAYVSIRSIGDVGDISWPYNSLLNMLGGQLSTIALPTTYPGSVNTLLWWTTTNFQGISNTDLEPGLEAYWSLISRASWQRSFSTSGESCVQSII